MTNNQLYVEAVVSLAKDLEDDDPIDWGVLAIDEDTAIRMIASSVVEKFDNKYLDDYKLAMLATITKLVVENFTLNLKLQQGKNNGG